mmetsp:Transcript_22704/g.35536  ORF Transcript_22704/g.35536 Transcript_22704/m.35536 type:complete len:194 (+) Transcript_22704:253-834(+)
MMKTVASVLLLMLAVSSASTLTPIAVPSLQVNQGSALRLRGGADSLASEASKLGKVAVTFEVCVSHIRPKNGPPVVVKIVGSSAELGAWDPARGVPLICTADTFPIFTGVAFLDPNSKIEYKFVVEKAEPGGDGPQQQWEAVNRELAVGAAGAMTVRNEFRESRLTDPRISDEPYQLTAQEWCRFYKNHVSLN